MLSGYIMLPSPLPRYIRAGLIETFEVKHSDFLSGRGVTNPAFTGSVAELDSEFVTHVRPFLIALLAAWSWSMLRNLWYFNILFLGEGVGEDPVGWSCAEAGSRQDSSLQRLDPLLQGLCQHP